MNRGHWNAKELLLEHVDPTRFNVHCGHHGNMQLKFLGEIICSVVRWVLPSPVLLLSLIFHRYQIAIQFDNFPAYLLHPSDLPKALCSSNSPKPSCTPVPFQHISWRTQWVLSVQHLLNDVEWSMINGSYSHMLPVKLLFFSFNMRCYIGSHTGESNIFKDLGSD